jgi:cytidyltransferase-like protein
MILNSYDQLSSLRNVYKDKIIVLCSGSFDLTHPGHGLFFENCKREGDILVVQVASDSDIKRLKGENRPVYNQEVRLKAVDLMKPVDYCFIQNEIPENEKDYLYPLFPVFQTLKPNKWGFTTDVKDLEYRIEVAKRFGLEIFLLDLDKIDTFQRLSTTKTIDRIKNYNKPIF